MRNRLMVPRQRRALLALGFYSVATVLLSAPLAWNALSTVARAVRQDVWLNVWALAWTSEHLLTGPARLFDANIFFPHTDTLAYSDHFIGEALLAAPIYSISGSAVLAYNVAWFGALILTGWGGYLWVRAMIGDEPAGEAAALVAGAVCLLVPGKRTALSHLQVISLQGVTLSLFAAHLLLQRATWKRSVALAAATVYAALSSWYTAAYTGLLLPLLGGVGVFVIPAGPRRWRTLAYGAGALLLAAAILYPVAMPYRAVQLEMEFERPLDELVATSLSPIDFVSSWSWLHQLWMPQGSGAGGYFPGFLALGLALLGLRDGVRRADRWPLVYGGLAAVFCLLALGPRWVISESTSIPLPYDLLFRFVPGLGALRNPYRAAFFATILFSVPVGYGARVVIERGRAAVLQRQRWSVRPRLGALPPTTLALALILATVHLAESWSGPQEITPLPPAASDVYGWLAREDPGAAALSVPLPRPFDDNARYQLWTIGAWVPLVNGHSGLYPGDFLQLYAAGAEFPEPGFLRALKERFPVRYVVAHYGLMDDGPAARAAARDAGLEEVYEGGGDVVYRIGNGAAGGWARRRMPVRMLARRMAVDVGPGAAGCAFRVVVDGKVAGEVDIEAAGAATVDVSRAEALLQDAQIEMYLVHPGGTPRVDVRAGREPLPRASLLINGVALVEAPVVVAILEASSGRVVWSRAAASEQGEAGLAVRQALEAASAGDELFLAIAEESDQRLIERLRLLLDAAGGGADLARAGVVGAVPLVDVGGAYAFRGRIGAAAGSAREDFGDSAAEVVEGDADGDCRRSPILGFEMMTDLGSR